MTNLIASEAAYNGGLFPKIPERMSGQDTLLVNANGIAFKVDNFTTTKDIRKGNYNKVVRVSILPFTLKLTLKAMSKNKPYEFDVEIDVECKIKDSLAYFTNKAAHDVTSSISTALLRIITPIAKMHELTDNEIDHELMSELKQHGDCMLEALGVSYKVLSVDAEPDAKAVKFVKEMTDSTLNVRVKQHIDDEAIKLTSRSMESAIMEKVASGKMDMQTALEQLSAANRKEGHSKLDDMQRIIEFMRDLQEKNLITDDEAGQRISGLLGTLPSGFNNDGTNENTTASVNKQLKDANDESYEKEMEDLYAESKG